ncbi:MAG: hypothetical protein WAK03_15395, partial [Methylocystis sp.]
ETAPQIENPKSTPKKGQPLGLRHSVLHRTNQAAADFPLQRDAGQGLIMNEKYIQWDSLQIAAR